MNATTISGTSITSGITLNQSEYSYDDVNTSQSSGDSQLSEIGSSSVATTKKQKQAAKKLSKKQQKLDQKKEKRRKKNKITKEDFYNKSLEFRIWLSQEKRLVFEDLPKSKSKELFKKFVKKWNGKKLAVHYYRGVDMLWAIGSPGTQSMWAMPGNVEVTPGSLQEEALEQQYSRMEKDAGFSTFGKREGARALKELQRRQQMENADESLFLSREQRAKDSALDSLDFPVPPPSLAGLFDPPSKPGELVGQDLQTLPNTPQLPPKMGIRGKVANRTPAGKRVGKAGVVKPKPPRRGKNTQNKERSENPSEESPSKKQKLQKQDSYIQQIESAGKAVQEILESARRQHLSVVTSPVKSRPAAPFKPLAPQKPHPPQSAVATENKPHPPEHGSPNENKPKPPAPSDLKAKSASAKPGNKPHPQKPASTNKKKKPHLKRSGSTKSKKPRPPKPDLTNRKKPHLLQSPPANRGKKPSDEQLSLTPGKSVKPSLL